MEVFAIVAEFAAVLVRVRPKVEPVVVEELFDVWLLPPPLRPPEFPAEKLAESPRVVVLPIVESMVEENAEEVAWVAAVLVLSVKERVSAVFADPAFMGASDVATSEGGA